MKYLTIFVFSMSIMSFSLIRSTDQILNTSLTITVRDDLGNLVKGAEVRLFESEEDYQKEQNVAFSGVSDEKGLVKLKKLKSISYYAIVRKDDKDNSGGGEIIGKLEEGKFNKVTIVIQ